MEKKKPRQLYFKLFRTYTAIVVCIVIILVVYFISASQRRALETNERDLQRISMEAADYIRGVEQNADYLHKDLYRSNTELEDLLAYLGLEPDSYQKFSLNRYSNTDGIVNKGFHSMINEAFEAFEQLEKIELISYTNLKMTECYPEKSFYPGKNGWNRSKEVDQDNYGREGKITLVKQISDPATMKTAGCMIFTFDGEEAFREILKESEYASLAVTLNYTFPVFQGGARQESMDWESLELDHDYLVEKDKIEDYQVYAWLEKSRASSISAGTFFTIIGMGVLAVILGVACISFYVRRLTRRVDGILQAMEQVTTGDLSVRLDYQEKGDELDMVSENFNHMCSELQLYIQKSYLAEIERKNAHLQALQSQINPHFLYNTLEAIRMKAICSGDREVGKMLYSMVTLFRSQLKEADVITLGQELDYCKQYLELFEYRYPGQFHSWVECPPELLERQVIKFVLQPILENYFVHGIDRNRTDNRIAISARLEEEKLILSVEDNGRGMPEREIQARNRELAENAEEETGEKQKKKSIGIANVNRRIKAVYGEEYGIRIEAAKTGGLLVKVTVRAEKAGKEASTTKEGKEHEESHVSRR